MPSGRNYQRPPTTLTVFNGYPYSTAVGTVNGTLNGRHHAMEAGFAGSPRGSSANSSIANGINGTSNNGILKRADLFFKGNNNNNNKNSGSSAHGLLSMTSSFMTSGTKIGASRGRSVSYSTSPPTTTILVPEHQQSNNVEDNDVQIILHHDFKGNGDQVPFEKVVMNPRHFNDVDDKNNQNISTKETDLVECNPISELIEPLPLDGVSCPSRCDQDKGCPSSTAPLISNNDPDQNVHSNFSKASPSHDNDQNIFYRPSSSSATTSSSYLTLSPKNQSSRKSHSASDSSTSSTTV